MTFNPFETLGLPARPDLDDEQVRAAWRAIAAATHPDRPDGGDPAWYAQASAAYAQLNSPWGRSEAYADHIEGQPDTTPLPAIPAEPAPAPRTWRPLRLLPSRITHGRPLRLLIRAIIAAVLSLVVLCLVPGTPAAPADVLGLVIWFALTARSDPAPPLTVRRGRCLVPRRPVLYPPAGRGSLAGQVTGRKARPVPPDQWIWSPDPVHPALVDRATWDAAQKIGAQRGNVRDPETPTSQPGRRYILRSRIRCRICQRRMCGIWRPAPASGPGAVHVYYRCPHDPANPRHAAACPDHPPVSLREDTLMAALEQFFDQYVFGPDRAGLLAATATAQAEQQARQIARLRTDLARIDTAERALISELEQPADPADPATQAYRQRIRARYAELYDQRTRTQAQLDAVSAAVPHDTDPALLDTLPIAARVLADAPDRIKAALIAAFDISALYDKETHQVTIRASLTEDTPRTIAALLADPRTDHDTWHHPAPPADDTAARGEVVSQLGRGTPVHQILP